MRVGMQVMFVIWNEKREYTYHMHIGYTLLSQEVAQGKVFPAKRLSF